MKVLMAIDSSTASQYVIAEAVSRPWPSGTIFCVQSIVDMWIWDGLPELIEDAKHQARTLVAAATDELKRSGLEVVSEIQAGLPKKAIPEYAQEWGADLIMVGSRGLRALARFSSAALHKPFCVLHPVRLRSCDRVRRRFQLLPVA